MAEIESTKLGVVGAGIMGSGIAQVLAIAGHEVVCQDIDQSVIERAKDEIATGRFGLASAVERGKLDAEAAEAALARVTFTTDLDAAVATDVILEAIPERLDLKLRFWKDVDRRAAEPVIFCSNSSGFPITAIAGATDRGDRVVGWHWASPAPVMKLAEITRGPETSDATVDTVVALAAGCGKNPVVINDAPASWGYVANRVYGAMVREAMRVVDEGVATREQVDQLMMDCFRWPSGPFGMSKGATSGWNK